MTTQRREPAAALRARNPDRGTSEADETSLLALVDRLAAILEASDLVELEVESGATGLVLRKPEALAPAVTHAGVAPAGPLPAQSPEAARPATIPAPGRGDPAAGPGPGTTAPDRAPGHAGRLVVAAPLTGIWYASPNPGSPPFVSVGSEVSVGQVIGLIEAMKLFNEIKSDRTGRVARVVPDNGALVKAKQPLIEVEPLFEVEPL